MFAENLAPLFADFGVIAVFGGRTASVVLDMPEEEIFDGMQQSSEYSMTFVASDFPSLKSGDTGTVDGISYRIRQVNSLDDGKLAKAQMQR